MSTSQNSPRVLRSSPHHPGDPSANGSSLSNPASLIVAGMGFVFVAYVFNFHGVATSLDSYFGDVNQAAQSHQQAVATVFLHAVPAIVGALVLFLMLVFLRAGSDNKTKQTSDSRGIEAFVESAAAEGISSKVARAAYRLLLPYVRRNKQLGVDDTLFHDLKLTEDQLSDVYGSLLRLSDRHRRVGDDGAGIRGVTGLMMAVESSEEKPPAGTITGKISRNHIAASLAAKPAPKLVAVPDPAPAEAPVAVMAAAPSGPPRPVLISEAKPRTSAVVLHPARLPRPELSTMRSRPLRGAQTRG